MRTQLYVSTFLFGLVLPLSAWSQPELVTGYYDSNQDWFVFQWDHPDYGKRKTILDSSNKIKPSIHAAVSLDSSGNYAYSFEVSNQSGAVQLLQDVYIHHPAPIFDAVAPTPQSDWDMGEYRNKGIWVWSKVKGPDYGIRAGQTQEGFLFKSRGLPAIVDAEFSGKRRERFSDPGDEDPDGAEESFDRVYAALKAQYPDKFVNILKLKTLGPINPPTTMVPGDFLEKLIALSQQALSLGWIKKSGIEQSLEAKLNNAAKKLQANDTKAAKNILTAFLNEVQAQNGKQLTSEAYALLYFNGKYLVDHL